MVERHLAKVEVAGSSPVIRSKAKKDTARVSFLLWSTGARWAKHSRAAQAHALENEFAYSELSVTPLPKIQVCDLMICKACALMIYTPAA